MTIGFSFRSGSRAFLFLLFIVAMSLGDRECKADPVDQVVQPVMLQMKSRSQVVFNKWYQPYVLRTFCPNIYANYRGDVPLITISGNSGVRKGIAKKGSRPAVQSSGLYYKIEKITEKCTQPEIPRGLLKHYWTYTGEKLYGYYEKLDWYLRQWAAMREPKPSVPEPSTGDDHLSEASSTTSDASTDEDVSKRKFMILTDAEASALSLDVLPDSLNVNTQIDAIFGNPEKDLIEDPSSDPKSIVKLLNQVAASHAISQELQRKALEIEKDPKEAYQESVNEYEKLNANINETQKD